MTKNIITKKSAQVESEIVKAAEGAINEVQQIVDSAEQKIESTVAPVRKSILKRFPVMFLLAVTFGFTATVTGMEKIIAKYEFLESHPAIILLLGIGTLVLTGTLYKKLG